MNPYRPGDGRTDAERSASADHWEKFREELYRDWDVPFTVRITLHHGSLTIDILDDRDNHPMTSSLARNLGESVMTALQPIMNDAMVDQENTIRRLIHGRLDNLRLFQGVRIVRAPY